MNYTLSEKLKELLSPSKTAVYTAIFGDKQNILQKPLLLSKNCDYYCFSDQDQPDYGIFKCIKSEPLFKDDANRSAKHYKVFPEKYLSDYKRSIWFDGTMELKRDNLNTIAKKSLSKNPIAVFRHFDGTDYRDCIYEEAKVCIERELDNPEAISNWISRLKDEQYPRNNGLAGGGFIIRRHNDQKVREFSEKWWDIIVNYSRRDQLSFNYVAWKLGVDILYLDQYGNYAINTLYNWNAHLRT